MASSGLSSGQKLIIPAAGQPATPVVTASMPVAAAIPAPAAPAISNASTPAAQTHTVQQGETMYQIARKYGVTVIDLLDMNNRTDTNLKPGESLVVKKK